MIRTNCTLHSIVFEHTVYDGLENSLLHSFRLVQVGHTTVSWSLHTLRHRSGYDRNINLLFTHEVVIKCGCMAVPLCGVRNSSPIVWHPAVRVTISVVTAATQHLLLCTNRAQGEGECEGEREQQTSVDDYLTPDHRVIKAEPAPSTPLAN